jgi:hypothetical protein
MSMKPLFNLLLVLASSALMTACNQYSNGGLVGDYQDTSKCPANGCANQAASANVLKMSTTGNLVSLYPASTDTKVEVSGDCYPSTYPSNKILVSVVTQNGNTPIAANVYSATGASTTPMCRNGKYDVVVDIRNLALSAIYTVKLELVAYDTAGVPHTNAGGGFLYLNLVR